MNKLQINTNISKKNEWTDPLVTEIRSVIENKETDGII